MSVNEHMNNVKTSSFQRENISFSLSWMDVCVRVIFGVSVCECHSFLGSHCETIK